MYLTGPEHPHKTESRLMLRRLIDQNERLVTDAEVFQEILHRYSSLRRHAEIQPTFDTLIAVVDEAFPIEEGDVFHAKDLLATRPTLSARAALHAAIMQRRG